jgi:hypothetical protein
LRSDSAEKAMLRLSLLLAFGLAAMVIRPAAAQFGPIFGNEPPRPPAELPQRSPRPDRAPAQPLPPGPPPSATPPPAVQTQPLPPPPAPPGAGAPADQANRPGQPTLPGSPPGQRQPRGTPSANVDPQPGDEVVVAPPAVKITNPTAVFSGLDKITGRIINFDVTIGETVQFGALQVTPRACYTRPPTETPNTDAFLEVDEVTLQGEVRRIFTGWMFAASPGLHAVEHPIYDVWLMDCKGGTPPTVTAAQPDPPERQAQPERPRPQQRDQQPREQRPQRQQRPPLEPPPFFR